eukprot:jgi/Tetstr1/464495/TSEL_009253.t1
MAGDRRLLVATAACWRAACPSSQHAVRQPTCRAPTASASASGGERSASLGRGEPPRDQAALIAFPRRRQCHRAQLRQHSAVAGWVVRAVGSAGGAGGGCWRPVAAARGFAASAEGGPSSRPSWDGRLAELRAFAEREGHARVPSDQGGLGRWVEEQRAAARAGRLPRRRVADLAAAGFELAPGEADWRRMLARLAAFREEHDHTRVPYSWPDDPALGRWVSRQRSLARRGAMPPERAAALDELDFVWDPADADWHSRFEELREFAGAAGHCRVPALGEDGARPSLSLWVRAQRAARRAGRLRPERGAALSALGLAWEPKEEEWSERFEELRAFHAKHGHFQVPEFSSQRLHAWVRNIRAQRRRGELSAERVAALDGLGFVWEPKEARWRERLAELAAFQRWAGHGRVPPETGKHRHLARWAQAQVAAAQRRRLPAHQEAELRGLGVLGPSGRRARRA